MPQWDFLDFLSNRARRFPSFHLLMQHEAVGLLREGNTATGVEARTPNGPLEIRARLVVGCDGRHSTIRQAANLDVLDFGVPIDVLWFRLSRKSGDPEQVLGNINFGKALILINRGDYFQSGLIIPKGSFERIQRSGLDGLHDDILKIAPYLGDRVLELSGWDQIKLLTVQINRLRRWHLPGLLCIGDAAHAMSPAGGVGINLAIQDAVATANLIAERLGAGPVPENVLARVQERREFPTRVTQFMQVNAHKAFARIFENPGPLNAPWQLRAVVRLPGLQRLIGRAVGLGVRPEHIRSASAK
jgi:2-polyprenyl-6-methoxyphenol hydroxylase-like FAD-dependent oxidoreductase